MGMRQTSLLYGPEEKPLYDIKLGGGDTSDRKREVHGVKVYYGVNTEVLLYTRLTSLLSEASVVSQTATIVT